MDGVAWNRYDTLMSSDQGHSTDKTRVPGQKVRISRSDRWIALKLFHEFSKAIFDGVAWNRYVTPMPSGRGHSTDSTRVPGQKVRSRDPTIGSRSNFFHEFPEAVFDGVAWNRNVTPMPSGWGHSTNRIRVPDQKVRISRSDRWIPLKYFSRVSGGCFRWSSMEMGTTRRSRPVGAIPPTRLEYRVKRSVSRDPTVGSR